MLNRNETIQNNYDLNNVPRIMARPKDLAAAI